MTQFKDNFSLILPDFFDSRFFLYYVKVKSIFHRPFNKVKQYFYNRSIKLFKLHKKDGKIKEIKTKIFPKLIFIQKKSITIKLLFIFIILQTQIKET